MRWRERAREEEGSGRRNERAQEMERDTNTRGNGKKLRGEGYGKGSLYELAHTSIYYYCMKIMIKVQIILRNIMCLIVVINDYEE